MATKVKFKPKKAALARFKVSATGKLMHHTPGRRHILTSKTSKRKRHMRKVSVLAPAQVGMVKKMLGLI